MNQLALYGLMQAVIIQQDAIGFIAALFEIPRLSKNDSNLQQILDIRSLRNRIAGHPSETRNKEGAKTYTTIRTDFKGKKVEYFLSGVEHGSRIVDVDKIISSHEKSLKSEINRIIKEVIKTEEGHMAQFKQEKLEDIFEGVDNYIQKIFSFEKNRTISKLFFESLKQVINNFKTSVEKRYGVTDYKDMVGLHGLVDEIEQVEKYIPKIESMILLGEHVDPLDLDVYTQAIQSSLDQLKKMAEEVDEEFH